MHNAAELELVSIRQQSGDSSRKKRIWRKCDPDQARLTCRRRTNYCAGFEALTHENHPAHHMSHMVADGCLEAMRQHGGSNTLMSPPSGDFKR